MDNDAWPAPRVTGNAMILLGFLIARMHGAEDYMADDVDAAVGEATLRHTGTGNLYRVTVQQISGTE
jgi:hypothetical protein